VEGGEGAMETGSKPSWVEREEEMLRSRKEARRERGKENAGRLEEKRRDGKQVSRAALESAVGKGQERIARGGRRSRASA